MEGMQVVQHAVADGVYEALVRWRLVDGVIEIKQADGWVATTIPVDFQKYFDKLPDSITQLKRG